MPWPIRLATLDHASWLRLPVLVLGLAAATGTGHAKTFCIPHVFDQKGRVSNTPYTFDTDMFFTYSPNLGTTSPGAQVDLYLYDDSGAPMRSQTNADVCNPCSFALGAGAPRKRSLSVEDLIDAAGGFTGVKLGFGVVVVGGADPDNVAVQGYIVNSHATPGVEVAAMSMDADELGDTCDGIPDSRRVLVLPHVFDTSGRVATTPYTFDTSMFMTYAGGLAGSPPGAGASVDLYLLDDAGGFLVGGGGGPVCAPCSFQLGGPGGGFKETVALETYIDAAGGYGPLGTMQGTALLDLSGDADQVSIQGFVVNSHSSAFDVSVFGFNPQEITAPGRVANVNGEARAGRLSLAVAPNPSRTASSGASSVVLSFELPAGGELELAIHDVNGRRVATVARGTYAAGVHRLTWNGLEESGARVSPGAYFARLTDASGSTTSRIVAIR